MTRGNTELEVVANPDGSGRVTVERRVGGAGLVQLQGARDSAGHRHVGLRGEAAVGAVLELGSRELRRHAVEDDERLVGREPPGGVEVGEPRGWWVSRGGSARLMVTSRTAPIAASGFLLHFVKVEVMRTHRGTSCCVMSRPR